LVFILGLVLESGCFGSLDARLGVFGFAYASGWGWVWHVVRCCWLGRGCLGWWTL